VDILAHQMARDIKDAFIEEETKHDEFVDSLLKAIHSLVRTKQDEDILPTPAETAETTVPGTPPPPPPATDKFDSDEIKDVTPAGANCPPQDRNLWQELSNHGYKCHPNPLSPGSEQQSRGRSSVRWDHNNDDIDCPPLRATHNRNNHSSNGFIDNNDNDVSWNNKRSNRYNTDKTWASTSRESYNHMRRAATNHFGNKTIRASSANADSNVFNPEQSSGAALKLKQLTDIAIHRPLSTQEMNQWKVLHASATHIQRIEITSIRTTTTSGPSSTPVRTSQMLV
jgi:hypothetical protein